MLLCPAVSGSPRRGQWSDVAQRKWQPFPTGQEGALEMACLSEKRLLPTSQLKVKIQCTRHEKHTVQQTDHTCTDLAQMEGLLTAVQLEHN